ncbi:conserved hypothetical protein [Verticillium alfalfae VaMs.102]|uniref:Reverse transcriptase domain-containing protein n=1 Tax=Verticillium alfalfae (strain VaMs.102 / ATCC MYA-4576 / FGSC 10136) TaxID=526221 RepID=C9S968_VERA1|nr:conserved hypothetical protein [Verticillium alfalfae VaMs.102]EEY14116.1 conserved hypothetical protein [Verticillium alfalfae VaMs.102]
MASSEILSQTLYSITNIKLDQLDKQKNEYESAKRALLDRASDEPEPKRRALLLAEGLEKLPSMTPVADSSTISLENLKRFILQAKHDPSVSQDFINDYEQSLRNELNVQSEKYRFAELYGKLVNEWISAGKADSTSDSDTASNAGSDAVSSSGFLPVGRAESHEQRATWEDWGVLMRSAFSDFLAAPGVPKTTVPPMDKEDARRRMFFLNTPRYQSANGSVHQDLDSHYRAEVLLDQLPATMDEQRGGYNQGEAAANDSRKSHIKVVQNLLHILQTSIIMKTRLGQDITVIRSDFKWFGPSVPHSSVYAVLEFFGVDTDWIAFFRKALECPLRFEEDPCDAQPQVRKRGTPLSTPIADFFAESMLFCLDFAVNQKADGARLYRLHDDMWLWGSEQRCVAAWSAITDFTKLMGLAINEEKTGSAIIRPKWKVPTPPGLKKGLPKGNESLFPGVSGGVGARLKQMIAERFGVQDVPDGYLYFPLSLGGLGLQNPFVPMFLLRESVLEDPGKVMDDYMTEEAARYRAARAAFESPHDDLDGTNRMNRTVEDLKRDYPDLKNERFFSYDEYTRYQERTSRALGRAFDQLRREPEPEPLREMEDGVCSGSAWQKLSAQERWVCRQHAKDMVSRFGGLAVVEQGLLPMGMMGMLRQSRFKWQG